MEDIRAIPKRVLAEVLAARIKEKLYEIAVELDLDFKDPEVFIEQNFTEDAYSIRTSIKANRLPTKTPR